MAFSSAKNILRHSKFTGRLCAALFVMLAVALAIASSHLEWNPAAFSAPVETLSDFTYEIAGGRSESATFPHSITNLSPNTTVTVYSDIEPGRYERLMVKTVYTGLKLYADDILIYECGQPGSYPAWLLDPPTLLKSVPVPATASRLRFEYISPSQRSTMSLPAITAGSADTLLSELFGKNAALMVISFLLLVGGLTVTLFSFAYLRSRSAGKPFINLGLFALATGCWGFGECNATAFLIPYPAFLYFIALGGLAAIVIPLLSYGLTLIRPRNPLFMRLIRSVLFANLIAVLSMQLFGIQSLSASLLIIQIFDILGLLAFAATAAWESIKHKNLTARQFALPSLILLVASVLDYINYSLRITQLLSLFYMTGTLIFTFMLGVIGMRYTRALMKDAEAAKRKEQITAAENASLVKYNQMKADWIASVSHETKTPLAVLSGYAELIAEGLREKGVDEQTACDLDNIAEEAQRIAGLMDELQRHICKQSDTLQKARLNLPALIDSAARLYTPILARKKNRLAVNLAGELSDVYASAGEVTQVLFNLLHNSHAHTENGDVSIAASRVEDMVAVTVSDDGTGVAPELMPHVFERGVSGREGGSGLGLAISKEIITDHGGEIAIANGEGGGASVRFTLPVWKENDNGEANGIAG